MDRMLKFGLVILFSSACHLSVAHENSTAVLQKEIETAHNQYLTGNAESALYALEALSRLLEAHQANSQGAEIGPDNLSFTYLRIGLLHEKSGNKTKATEYFQKALNSYKSGKVEIEQLKAVVEKLDSLGNS